MRWNICILLFALSNCTFAVAQVKLEFDTLRIEQLVYFHTLKKYDKITRDSVTIQFISENSKPRFEFIATINNSLNKDLILTTSECYSFFEIDNKKYRAYIDIPIHDTLVIKPFETKKLNLIAPDIFKYVRDKESNKRFELSPIYMKDRNDYYDIIYKILHTFRLIYEQEDVELISDTHNVIILSKYDEDNIERYEDSKK